MPRVPTYDSFQATPSTLPQTRIEGPQPFDVAGQQAQQTGQALQSLGGEAGRVALDMQEENNRAEAKDIDIRATRALNDLQFNPEGGFLGKRGKAAVDGYADSVKALDQVRRDALDSTRNPQVKTMIAPVLADRAMAASVTMERHYVAQRQQWQVGSSEARAEVTLRDAASDFTDPEKFARSLGTAHQEADAQGRLLGWDDATLRLRKEQYTDSAFKQRYEAWQQSDPAAALADFQRNGGQISPLARDQIGRKLFTDAAPVLAAQINAAGGVGMLTAPAADGTPVPPSRSPRGERNNNPGNLVKGSSPWEGEVSGADARFASFATPEHGIRALGKNLLTYQDTHGIDTVEGIISRWAPASENDTRAYVSAVAKAVGVAPDAKIDLHDVKTLTGITKAIIGFENGRQPYTDAQISLGLAAAQGTATLPPASSATPATAAGNPADNAAWRDPAVKTGNPVVDALPPDQKLRVLQLAKTQAHQDMDSVRAAVSIRARDAQAEYLALGTASNPPSEAEFIRAYGQIEGVAHYQALQGAAQLGNQMQQIKTLPEVDLRRVFEESKPLPGEGFAARERNFEILGKAIEQVRKARAEDPIKTALANPAYGIKPLTTFADPQAIATDLGARGAAMERISRDYGTPPRVMTDFEADQFGTYLRGLQAVDKARVLGQVAASVGPVGMQSISAQLKDKDSTLAIAGALAARQTTAGNSTARLYLEGKEMLAEKRAKIDATAETGIKAQIFSKLDGVYLSPLARDAAADASLGIYAKLKAEGSDDLERAMRLATGGLMDFNGARIAKPYGWDDARFSDALQRIDASQLSVMGRTQQGYGNRGDGSNKGDGFLGPLRRPDGNVSTEISIGVHFDGAEREIPTLVPTLSKSEVDSLLRGDAPSKPIVDKAVAHARKRIAAGLDPFAAPEESPSFMAGGQQISAKDLARMLPGARLQTFGDGSYLVRAGSDIVRRADGSPFVLKVGR